ncbi:MAG TPA: RNA 2',3'-cyclic phosphodiesterase [Nocardioidaceae bacterium]|nr:RNA 2',3'-cyclic phosphodiesterase [Nocardioidaceae bacterium]
MRLFVAVELPAAVRSHLDSRTGSLRQSMPDWRWTPPAQWHLTLAFLGEVPEETLPELSRRMGLAARRHRPFRLELAGLGAFNNLRRARILWAGVDGDREALTRLADSVSAGARRAKIRLEERPYRPHLTLGRRRAPVDLRESPGLAAGYQSPSWPVEEFVLVQSHLGSAVRHEIRERYPLARKG